ncbi:hypothetical protein DAPPUDRAFT_337093 [Daphnia pulex]|uniref:Uncharacterized protein n=1 Tax=Daphnia pulex TaxID=6669 RepID=E9I0Z4_DAPPU|nr:hypothetical protein DAPPUDRAFT_337093 [Daphnia pulex]|eukprot:EFX62334.1 hypothetical protein DAPPUDRAFT_337093 [Daphnia pulex]
MNPRKAMRCRLNISKIEKNGAINDDEQICNSSITDVQILTVLKGSGQHNTLKLIFNKFDMGQQTVRERMPLALDRIWVTTPFANNQPSQFTPGYPSSNLPNGRMLSAPSPTVNSSLLTPSTDPSSNFQTGQQQGNCCQGVLVELQNLQKEVGKLCKALQSNSSHTNSRRVLDFHHSFLQNLIDECPKNSVKSFVDLNTALKDPKLAISMLCEFCLVLPCASQGMQWKSSKRVSDCRQGLSHLDSLLAVIGDIAFNLKLLIFV